MLYHWSRFECSCVDVRTGKALKLDCAGAPALTIEKCTKLQAAVDALRAAIANAEIVRMGSLAVLQNQVPLPKEERAALADLMDACKEATE
jgi:hypothetical protein